MCILLLNPLALVHNNIVDFQNHIINFCELPD